MNRFVLSLAVAAALLAGCATAPAGLAVPEPIWPKTGSTFDHFPRTTELRWGAVPGATVYSIEIDCFHCCEIGKWCTEVNKPPRMKASRITGTSYKFSWVGANLGRWRVWAVGPEDKESEKSAWQDFLYTR